MSFVDSGRLLKAWRAHKSLAKKMPALYLEQSEASVTSKGEISGYK